MTSEPMPNMGLDGRVVLVTGSTRGIGRTIAEAFARQGAQTIVNGRTQKSVERTASELQSFSPDVLPLAADVSDAAAVQRMFEAIDERFGQIDVLVNNAALVWDVSRHFLDMDERFWDGIMAVNLRGMFSCASRAAHRMASRRQGVIINMSSVGGARAHRESIAYDATKGGIDAATRAMALDLAPWGVRVNALAPGWTRTEDWLSLSEKEIARGRQTVPLGREGTGADVAAVAVFLASDWASYITGQVLYVDGGLLAQLRSPEADISPTKTPEDDTATERSAGRDR
jgi:3-oxoacyl-[acyl-carrier protein] reductase